MLNPKGENANDIRIPMKALQLITVKGLRTSLIITPYRTRKKVS